MTRSLAALVALALLLTGCAANPNPNPSTPDMPDRPLVAFYGDSYTLGTGASDPSRRWSTEVAAARGWYEFNPSVNGLGFINNRRTFGDGDLPDQIIDVDPDVVFVTMGLNDNFSFAYEPDRIRAQIDDDLDRIATALPDALLIVVEPFWYTDERPESVETIIGWVRDAAGRVDAEYIPGASHWIEGRPELMAADGLHPNDAGYRVMAEQMEESLAELGLGVEVDTLPEIQAYLAS